MAGAPGPSDDIVSSDRLTVTLLPNALSVGRILTASLKGCSWPLLKSMLSCPEDRAGFFSLTQEEDEVTLVLDERCRAAFDEAAHVAAVEYASSKWRAFELRLGSLEAEVPGVVCFLSTVMADERISILNLSSHDRDFLLVQQGDVAAATAVIRERMRRDVDGLKEDIAQGAAVRRCTRSLAEWDWWAPSQLPPAAGGGWNTLPGLLASPSPRSFSLSSSCLILPCFTLLYLTLLYPTLPYFTLPYFAFYLSLFYPASPQT